MRKKLGFKFASVSVAAPDGKELVPRLKKLLWSYADAMRPCEPTDTFDLSAFMLYSSYVSRNADELGIEDFDLNFSIDEVVNCLGNEYVAASYVEYYAGLCVQNASLPDLSGLRLRAHDLSKAITTWAELLDASGLSLMDDCDFRAAATIQGVLAEMYTSDAWGKFGGEFATPLPIADLATRLVDVEEKSVLDFACGNGVYLASALSKGAASACGRDISDRAVMRAKIGCFFADPTARHDIAAANALTAASTTPPAQRVFVAPPLGVRLREFDIQEKGYYADVMTSVIGDVAVRTSNMEDFCVAKAFACLANDGVAVLHVSASFLFNQQKARQVLRGVLVEGGCLQTVIELPGGIIPGTGVKSALLVIGKQPTNDGVLIIDLDSKDLAGKGYVTKSRGRCKITEVGIDWLAKTVELRKEIPLAATIVEREKILANGSNLYYSAYGEVVDYEAALDEVRSVDEILSDMRDAQLEVDALRGRIEGILELFKEKE